MKGTGKVGEKIKIYLVKNKITETQLSELTGISLAKISLIVTGKRRLSLEEYQVICFALGVKVGTFLEPQKPICLSS